MATQTVAAPTVVKRAGPPVPPRPQHTAGLLKTQRDSVMNAMSRTTTTTQQPSSAANGRVAVANATEHSQATAPHQVIHRKPTMTAATAPAGGGGRTIIYKSPSMHLPKRREEQQPVPGDATNGAPLSTRHSIGTPAPRPPLKLRKAPDVPTAQKPKVEPKAEPKVEHNVDNKAAGNAQSSGDATELNHKVELRHSNSAPRSPQPSNNIVIVQSSNGVSLSRHHSMGSPKTNGATVKDTRLSLGRADLERVSVGGKIQLDQLQPAQPLPKPRKIVKVPVATLDIEGTNLSASASPSSNASAVSGIFRRSKTTLDNFASRANITTISTVSASNSFLSGKTAEIKNNLKNAAERLFSEIIVNQQKHIGDSPTIITKHERAVQHQALLEQELLAQERARRLAGGAAAAITVVASEPASNCTRININATTPTRSTTAADRDAAVISPTKSVKIENILSSTEKKAAFHEILISELAAMRARSSSMENLQTKDPSMLSNSSAIKPQMTTKSATTTPTKASNINNNCKPNKIDNNLNNLSGINSVRKRCNSVEDPDPDTEDVDADNVEDAEGDEDESNKTRKVGANNSPRKRCPSGCSSDSSPYGTERSARIRTSDWIEVGDNGKEVTMTSCHISLEDSGLEDEERLDEMSSSGVGDSWDSVKEAENVKRCRNVKRIMSITDLPPLPKSLSGFNKMLGSDSGLISDADVNAESNNNNNNNLNSNKSSSNNNLNNSNNNIKLEYQKDVTNSSNNNNHNNIDSNSSSTGNSNENVESTTITEGENELSATTASATQPTAAATATTTTAGTGSTLDTQLAILRKEMYGLRQLDLSLLSQLWTLNDSIQEFRTMLEEQDQENDDPDSYSPHSRTPSSYDSASSDGEEDTATNHSANKSTETTPKIITTQPKLKKSNSSATAAAEAPPQKPAPSTPSMPIANANAPAANGASVQQLTAAKPPLPRPLDVKPVPRMRSAPPPPPVNRKAAAPPRPT